MQRRAHMPRPGRTRTFWQLRHGVPHALPRGYRRQLERHHEGCASRGLRRLGGLREKLLRGLWHSTNVFRNIRINGAIRVSQRGGRRAHETPRRVSQTGKTMKTIYDTTCESK